MKLLYLLSAIPTWFFTASLIVPFLPKSHPWHGRRFTLGEWHAGRTTYTKFIDFLLWFYGVLAIVILVS